MQCIVTYSMVCIRMYLHSVLRYKFLILDAYHLVTPYVRDVGIHGKQKGPASKEVWETLH